MRREVVWSAWDGVGLEHLRLTVRDDGAVADAVVIGMAEGRPFRVRYEVRCDAGWRTRAVRVSEAGSGSGAEADSGAPWGVELLADGEGNWTAPGLEGCMDVDISATPFTNTLPIRRLGLAPGESAELSVAYVDASEIGAWTEQQRYTCLKRSPRGGLYRYESLDGGFTADLPVDADGLVLDYPGLFRRAFSA